MSSTLEGCALELLVDDVLSLIFARAGFAAEYSFAMTNKFYYNKYIRKVNGIKRGDFVKAIAAAGDTVLLDWAFDCEFHMDASCLDVAAQYGHRKIFNYILMALELESSSRIVAAAAEKAGLYGRIEFFDDPPMRTLADSTPQNYIPPIIGFKAAIQGGYIEMAEFLLKYRRIEIEPQTRGSRDLLQAALKGKSLRSLDFIAAKFPRMIGDSFLLSYDVGAHGNAEVFEWFNFHFAKTGHSTSFTSGAFECAFSKQNWDLARYIASKYENIIVRSNWESYMSRARTLAHVKFLFDDLNFDITHGDVFSYLLDCCVVPPSHIENSYSFNFDYENIEKLRYVIAKGCPIDREKISSSLRGIDDELLSTVLKEQLHINI